MQSIQRTHQSSEYLNPHNPDILVHQFFRDFSFALTEGDIASLKSRWALPSYIVGNAMQLVIKSENEIEKLFAGTKEQYNRRGITEALADIESIQWLTDKIALVGVRWPYYNREGHEIGEESSCYTLKVMPEGNLQIVCAVMQGASDESAKEFPESFPAGH